MKSLFSYLMVIFAVMYWIFRIAVCLMSSLKQEFVCIPYNNNIEILILFLTIPCVIGIIRRNVIVATLYFGIYGAYFGTVLWNDFSLGITDYTAMLINCLGVVIPFLIFLDIVIQKAGFVPENRNSDWYYENEKYDRQFDERADRNQYKIK